MAKKIGKVTHFFNRINVAVLKLQKEIKIGDEVLIRGRSTEFTQKVLSLQIDHKAVQSAGTKMEVALQVLGRVYKGDEVFLLEEQSSEMD